MHREGRLEDTGEVTLLQEAFLTEKPQTRGAARRISPASSDDDEACEEGVQIGDPRPRSGRRAVASRFQFSEGDFAQSLSRRLEKGLAAGSGGSSASSTPRIGARRFSGGSVFFSQRQRQMQRNTSSGSVPRNYQPRTLLSLLHEESTGTGYLPRRGSRHSSNSSKPSVMSSVTGTSSAVSSRRVSSDSAVSSRRVSSDSAGDSSNRAGLSNMPSSMSAPNLVHTEPYACHNPCSLVQNRPPTTPATRASPLPKAFDQVSSDVPAIGRMQTPQVSAAKLMRPSSTPCILPHMASPPTSTIQQLQQRCQVQLFSTASAAVSGRGLCIGLASTVSKLPRVATMRAFPQTRRERSGVGGLSQGGEQPKVPRGFLHRLP